MKPSVSLSDEVLKQALNEASANDDACVYDPARVVVDMRHTAPPAIPRSKLVGGRTVMRDPSTITGIVLHQMGCTLSVGPQRLRAANGDPALARVLRCREIPAHASVLTTGEVVAPHPLRAYLWHANGLNASTLGLEVEGLYDGRRRSGSRHPEEATLAAARIALRWLAEAGRAEGMPLRWLWAHRQASRSRRADPGGRLWWELSATAESLGLEPRPSHTVGDGRPIPRDWDPLRGVGAY